MAPSTSSGEERIIKGFAASGPKQELQPWQYTAPALRSTDVEIKISHCGICHSDIHTLDEDWGQTNWPIIVGHEIAGTITAVGDHVQGLKIGDRVGVGAQCGACLHCRQCKKGQDNLCRKMVGTYNGKHSDGRPSQGGYAEAVRVPYEFAFLIPDKLPSEVAAPLMCAGTTVYAPLRRHLKPNSRVGVIGIGGLGHLALQFAKALGAAEVVALSTSEKKKVDADKLGASKFYILKEKKDFAERAGSLDLIICTACSADMDWDSYIGLLGAGGKIVILGLPDKPITIGLAPLIFAQRSIEGSIIGARHEIEEMLEVAAHHQVLPWIEKLPMSKVNEGIKRMRNNDVKYRFVLEN